MPQKLFWLFRNIFTGILIILLEFSIVAVTAFAEGNTFQYDDHGKRDPFWPLVTAEGVMINYEKDLLISDVMLEGIIADANGKNMAIINGVIVKLNDQIGLFTVSQIEQDRVILLKGQKKFMLKLKKED